MDHIQLLIEETTNYGKDGQENGDFFSNDDVHYNSDKLVDYVLGDNFICNVNDYFDDTHDVDYDAIDNGNDFTGTYNDVQDDKDF